MVAEILAFLRELAHCVDIVIDREVAQSEADTGFRNASLANFIRSFGNLAHLVGDVRKRGLKAPLRRSRDLSTIR